MSLSDHLTGSFLLSFLTGWSTKYAKNYSKLACLDVLSLSNPAPGGGEEAAAGAARAEAAEAAATAEPARHSCAVQNPPPPPPAPRFILHVYIRLTPPPVPPPVRAGPDQPRDQVTCT